MGNQYSQAVVASEWLASAQADKETQRFAIAEYFRADPDEIEIETFTWNWVSGHVRSNPLRSVKIVFTDCPLASRRKLLRRPMSAAQARVYHAIRARY
jgi:hypothetical protein